MKRVWMLLLVAAMAMIATPIEQAVSAFLPGQDSRMTQQVTELEQKYGIRIEYDSSQTGGIIDETGLTTLDQALENVTPRLVRYVSAYYEKKTGNPLTFRYIWLSGNEQGQSLLAWFDEESALIELYIPSLERASMMTGVNPLSIVHEFGHALHLMCTETYGAQIMQEEWTAFNEGWEYDDTHFSSNPDERVFVSGYAATMYEEDVAETIGHVFVRYRAGQGFFGRLSEEGQLTGLGRKVAYIEQMLSAVEQGSDALQNYCRMYSAEPLAVYWQMSFSGDYLQFAGYPPPRHVLDTILDELDREAEETLWVEGIGGWHIRAKSGPELIVFPGGTWCEVGTWAWQQVSAW